ncbi:glycoside hydrolase family 13 protein [Protaetiibacter intestinalis]|uniref:Alpha-glucosidase n=1 Tax=Protaetiibacter intestinalis TaxID=2419774 RepID=A0A387B813_9MICO|nr:glycoside hydrolase family 13 protein [Protaetiibacter intestinalis]AYF97335.1 alpha-glucosidase [Protaetiibacter intestinalis]
MVDGDRGQTPGTAHEERTGASRGSALVEPWWRDAVIYQIYPRSFADGNGDGTGDLAGVREHLPYLVELGVDAIWFTPWYASPLADGGYDVADYRVIDPAFGTLAEAEQLITEALGLGIRTIIDVVPNHVSDRHVWFQAALAAGPGSPERERFWFRPGGGPAGDELPTDWVSSFGGDTWTRTTNPDGTPGEWYLHLFSAEQPDLNWDHPDVRREHEDILRFWFDRGVAGIRIDSAAFLVKDAALPSLATAAPGEHPHMDRDELHDIYRSWRSIADAYEEPRVLVGEVWLDDPKRFAAYLRPDEMHAAFNFDFMTQPWDAVRMRASIERTLREHAPVGAPATWVLSNHDVTRPVTRYGREDSGFAFERKRFGTPSDLELGTRRARAAALLVAALPGCLYIYQGDELGLPEVELPVEVLQDPMHFRSRGVDPGRDGCRVPLPWAGDAAPYGFGTGPDHRTWLPQPSDWAPLTVAAEAADPDSMLSLYRSALAERRSRHELRLGELSWFELGAEAIAFRRGESLLNVTNLGSTPLALPPHRELILGSAALEDGLLPPDSTVWLTL